MNRRFRSYVITVLISCLISANIGFLSPSANAAPDSSYNTGSGDGAAAYLNGTYVQASIANNGRFGSPTDAPVVGGVTWHPSGGRSNIGFVADRNRDGSWLDTDFFYPGTEMEEWGLNFGGTQGVFDYQGGFPVGATFSLGTVDVTPSLTSVIHTTTWGDFTIEQTYSARKGTGTFTKDQQLDVSVKLTNNSGAAINEVSYARTVDPDNLRDIPGGDHVTTNKIVSQYGVNGKNYSLVSATKSDPRQTPAGTSYLGLISSDARSKVSTGGFGISWGAPGLPDFRTMFTDGADAQAGLGTFDSVVNDEETYDRGMQILFTLGTISAGETKTFSFSYVLSESSAEDVISETKIVRAIPAYKIDWGTNTGIGYMNPQYAYEGSIVALYPNLYKKEGYTFAGWNTKADGTGTTYADGGNFKGVALDITLYAQWKLIQTKPTITWAPPISIQQGTALSATQLNAVASVPGTYTYSPAAAATLAVGKHSLKVTFVPTEAKYESIEMAVEIEVLAKPTLTWTNPASISEGTALAATQLNAVASVPGTYAYSPAAATVLSAGKQALKVTFTPTDTRLSPVSAEVSIEVTPVIPDAPGSPTYLVSGDSKTTITWSAAKNAASYNVLIDGKIACSAVITSCDVATLLGPKNIVSVTSVASGGKMSAPGVAIYAAPTSPQVLSVINFDSGKSVVNPSEAAKLRAFAATVKATGYTSLSVFGHTDSVGGVDNRKLSIARANATINYLKKLLPGVTFVLSGFAASEPVGDNSTAEGKAANRRAEIFIP
jgi:uncharacterized repeat protein (TIGR02543 family)